VQQQQANQQAQQSQQAQQAAARRARQADQAAQQQAQANQQAQQTQRQRTQRLQQQQAAEQQAAQAQAAQQVQAQQQQRGQRIANREARLSAARQQQLIQEQQSRNVAYKSLLQRQELEAQNRALALQRARRLNQYSYQQRYLERLRAQRLALANASSYDYNNDPYYDTAPTYRYQRAGRSYEVNDYAADLLRQAVNNGYEEGVRAGQADRQDGFRGDYRTSYAYQDANYGYSGMYVAQTDYNYYFREGFRRGYEDGFGNSSRYGTSSNGTMGILATVLSTILNLQQLR
jgi:hypothetical protein